MLENPDEIRQRYKQAAPGSRAATSAGACPKCWAVLVDGICFWCQHGCSACGAPISIQDGYCDMCGIVTFKCPGDGCRSTVHDKHTVAA